MGVESAPSPSRILQGLHGVQIVSQGALIAQEAHCYSEYNLVDDKRSRPVEWNQGVITRNIWHQRPLYRRPVHCCVHGDQNITETIANVLTSLPFIALGLQAPRKNFGSTLYANSLIGVGVASSLYHSSRGEVRKIMRWVDYAMIATTTVCLSRALRDENPRLLMAASAFCLPFQPLVVSVVHTGLMEVAFAKRALSKPELRTAHSLHTLSSLVGGALFVADDCFPQTPYIHAAWHLAAAVGVGTCNKLLE